MKNTYRTLWMCLLLTLVFAVPALAQTTGIQLDGKSYVFFGDGSTFEADGKTFILGDNEALIREPGKSDLVLPLHFSCSQSVNVVADASGAAQASEVQSAPSITITDATHEASDGSGASTHAIQEDAAGRIATGTAGNAAVVTVTDAAAQSGEEVTHSYTFTEAAHAVVCADTSYSKEYSRIDSATFEQYAQYGLHYDETESALYYNGQRVRIFEDEYPVNDQGYAVIQHYDALGTVDIKAQRDLSARAENGDGSVNPAGKLIGLYTLSGEAFAARELSQYMSAPNKETTATSGSEMTSAQKKALFAAYQELGLQYDETTDTLIYQNQSVRRFLDVQKSNGEPLSGGHFQGRMTSITYDSGEIDITILRDYAKPDAEGNGALIGISVDPVQ